MKNLIDQRDIEKYYLSQSIGINQIISDQARQRNPQNLSEIIK